jgi:hypothetical protein
MSWVIVQFPECREVFIDGQSQGDNVDGGGKPYSFEVNAGFHTFRLGGAANYRPPSQTIDVPEATNIAPFPVVFRKVP